MRHGPNSAIGQLLRNERTAPPAAAKDQRCLLQVRHQLSVIVRNRDDQSLKRSTACSTCCLFSLSVATFERSEKAPRWYSALADWRLRAALQAVHEDPGHPWTVPELAAISGLSRAAFARSFREAIGQAPLQYLTDWRMTIARDHLRTGTLSLTSIASEVGYGSPYAFAAAFRRHHGMPPGTWRKQQRSELLRVNGAIEKSEETRT